MNNDTAIIEPVSEKPHPVGAGVQRLYRFGNGYGASVVRFTLHGMSGSYGADAGLWELAVVQWHADDYHLTYDTPVTDDVVGHLTDHEVQEYLRQIRDLPAVES